jgi:mono/diheme cytochrome c family protein
MGNLLKPSELRDVIAWLASLDQGGENPPPATEPIRLDPATLPGAGASRPTAAASGIDPAFLKVGREQFILCAACHGQNGEGTAAGPPLAGSEWVTGPVENLIRIQLRGLQGPIMVKGKEYNFPAGMAPLAYQTDEQIAAALTYVRSSFGNSAPPVSPAAVGALRSEVGKPQITAGELIAPAAPLPSVAPAAPPVSGKYDSITPQSSYNMWIVIGIGIFIIGNIAAAIKFIKR